MRPKSWTSQLRIDGEPVHRIERLANSFIECRVGMDGGHHRLDRRLGLHRCHTFGNQLVCLWSDNVDAENLTELLVGNNLDESFMTAENTRFAVGGERELAHLHLITLQARLRFGQSGAANAGVGVCAGRNAIFVHRLNRLTSDVPHRDQTLHRRHMSQLRSSGHYVANGVDARFTSLLEMVYPDEAAFEFNIEVFQAEAFRVRFAAYSHQ